jgi:hypothetical protein
MRRSARWFTTLGSSHDGLHESHRSIFLRKFCAYARAFWRAPSLEAGIHWNSVVWGHVLEEVLGFLNSARICTMEQWSQLEDKEVTLTIVTDACVFLVIVSTFEEIENLSVLLKEGSVPTRKYVSSSG